MEENQNSNENPQINISIDEKTADGVYCNFPIVTYSETEFVLDFATMLPGMPQVKVQSRVVVTPETAHRLLQDLSQKLEHFQEQKDNESSKDYPIIYGEKAKA